MHIKDINYILRKSEDKYQDAIAHFSKKGIFFSQNLASVFITVLCVCAPELGALMLLGYILAQLTNYRNLSLVNVIHNQYEDRLLDSEGLEEEKINQNDLIRPFNPAVRVFGMASNTFFSQFRALEKFVSVFDATRQIRQPIDGIVNEVDRITDGVFRNVSSHDIMKLSYDGECHGLMKVWYASLILEIEDDFFEDMRALSVIAQRFFKPTLTTKQKNWVEVISTAQRENVYAETNVISLNSNKGEGLVEIKKLVDEVEGYCVKPESSLLDKCLDQVIERVLRQSLKNIGCLVELDLCKSSTGHAIGIVTHYTKEGTLVTDYFDGNRRRTRFPIEREEDVLAGKLSFMNLLKYMYRSYFENVSDDFKNVFVTVYNAHVLPKNYVLEDMPPLEGSDCIIIELNSYSNKFSN